ncbi:unnamed protein product [Symbiodinium natans]|uniref:Uncharacterized protein n=1 Tax=Symbiodinium natans TaxID=878477 RepID=A0A812PGY7_9DINO|nr:unnamed protein product [Symbiodinium natans]
MLGCKDSPEDAASNYVPELPPPPGCLGLAVWTNREVPPQDWGMTATQFREFLSGCRETTRWSWITEVREVVTLYDVIQQLVKPWTRGTGCGIALRMNHKKPCRATLMISHTWAEDMDECEEAIVDYCLESTSGLATCIWFCGFAQYQAGDEPGDIGPSIGEQLKLDPFGAVIRHTTPAMGMVVVHTSSARVYERLWCVYEISEATRLESKVGIAFSERYLKQRHTSLVDLLKARTDNAVCSNPADAEMIRSRIQDQGGFRALDWKIFSFRLESLRAVLAKKDPNWQNMLAEELKRAEEELNNWSIFGPSKSEKPSHSRNRMVMLLAMGTVSVGLVVAGAAVAAALRATEENWPEDEGPTTTLRFGTQGFGQPSPQPPPPPPPPPAQLESPAPSMDTALLVTLISLLFLGSVCLSLLGILALRRCRAPAAPALRRAMDDPQQRSQLDWEEKLQLAKDCFCEDTLPTLPNSKLSL